jgi:hypothetical protein
MGHDDDFSPATDLGRRVVYRPPGAGIITAIYTRRVFVRFDHQHYSRAVNPAYLEFVDRPSDLGDATKSL